MNNSTTGQNITDQLHHFTQNQLHILMMPKFRIMKKYPKLVKIPYYRLGVSSKFCHFRNVLKTLNNSYQQTHHLELNRMAQTICHSMYSCQDILNNWSTCACLQFHCVWILKTITSTYKGSRDQVVKSTIQHFRESRVLLSTSSEVLDPFMYLRLVLLFDVLCFIRLLTTPSISSSTHLLALQVKLLMELQEKVCP